MTKVLVCGGRHYNDVKKVHEVLNDFKSKHKDLLIVEGGANGADKIAKEWAKTNNIHYKTFKAKWSILGPVAGPMRNRRMINEIHPDYVIAFPGGKGTKDLVTRAFKAKIPVIEVI